MRSHGNLELLPRIAIFVIYELDNSGCVIENTLRCFGEVLEVFLNRPISWQISPFSDPRELRTQVVQDIVTSREVL